jgi:carbohydrate kinase (thermoresistant glucokinase family)
MPVEKKIFIIMGVSGCGKSTLGIALGKYLDIPFFDGDDFHPPGNIRKMSKGIPLEDSDREPWLTRLNKVAMKHRGKGAVIACSALKEPYRQLLQNGLEDNITWVYLYGTYPELLERVSGRSLHFMPSALLQSQFDALQPPRYGIHIPVSLSVDEAITKISEALNSSG